jgi:F-type H+-transporting ATPase subunit gamma
MANTKEIQRRIKSIGNTKKITRAMEMVAAAKMRKAVESVLKTRTYANLSWTTVLNLSQAINSGKTLHPLFVKRKKIKTVGIILVASNRGLCGGFNTAIINKAIASIKISAAKQTDSEKIKTEFIIMGKKAKSVYSRFKHEIAAEFPKTDISSSVTEVAPISRMVINDYLSGKYDKVMVAYTDFASASKQIPRVKQLLPIDIDAEDEYLGVVGKSEKIGMTKEYIKEKEDKYLRDKKNVFVFTYEPSPEEVLNEMLPRLIEIQLFQALLESNASEHSARMVAMRQATDAASDLVDELTLFFNKARQASITSEIAEISAGANALANK